MLQLCNSIEGTAGTTLKSSALCTQAAAPKSPARHRKQRRPPDVDAKHPNAPHHPTTDSPGKAQAQVNVKCREKMLSSLYGDCN